MNTLLLIAFGILIGVYTGNSNFRKKVNGWVFKKRTKPPINGK
jgi:hypothetical protein